MRPEIVPLDAGALSHREVPRFLWVAVRAWRGITSRQWAWTTAIALILLLANIIGILPVVLNVIPSMAGRQTDPSIARFVGGAGITFAAAYCVLLAVSIAEVDAGHRLPPMRHYVIAGIAALAAATFIETTLYGLLPSFDPAPGTLTQDTRRLIGRVVWSATSFGLTGGLALAVYVRFRSARLAREAFNAAELERVDASREVLASRLAAMQARIEPRFLLGTLAQVEALYERDPQAGDRMLDGLIAYLHAALPQLRGQRSTLEQEVQLAKSYLLIMQIRMGGRLGFRIEVHEDVGDCDFPPMVLLPLIEDALRNGLEPSPHGGTIDIFAEVAGDRIRVRVTDDGLPRTAVADDGFAIETLQERLRGLYGAAASLALTANAPQGAIATIEVPLDATRNHR